jgi:thiamine-phosphate pyrophosphorylase
LLLYYITARAQFSGDEAARTRCLLKKIAEAARCGIDYIQLREKDLPDHDLECLAREAMDAVRGNSRHDGAGQFGTRLLINSRADIALAGGADGVHLRAADMSTSEARRIWSLSHTFSGNPESQVFPVVSVSCHSDAEVALAAAEQADMAVLAPVFEKKYSRGIAAIGLEVLRRACRYNIPVLALGGVTLETIPACLNSGAAGIAAIRLFQENDIEEIVCGLRA